MYYNFVKKEEYDLQIILFIFFLAFIWDKEISPDFTWIEGIMITDDKN